MYVSKRDNVNIPIYVSKTQQKTMAPTARNTIEENDTLEEELNKMELSETPENNASDEPVEKHVKVPVEKPVKEPVEKPVGKRQIQGHKKTNTCHVREEHHGCP